MTTRTQQARQAGQFAGQSATGQHASHASRRHGDDAGGLVMQVDSLPSPVRLQMQLIARASSSPEDALAPIISLLVGSEARKCDAIVTAFRTHDALRDQWERTWEILRS